VTRRLDSMYMRRLFGICISIVPNALILHPPRRMHAGAYNEMDCQRPESANASLQCQRVGQEITRTRDCIFRVTDERVVFSLPVSMPVSERLARPLGSLVANASASGQFELASNKFVSYKPVSACSFRFVEGRAAGVCERY